MQKAWPKETFLASPQTFVRFCATTQICMFPRKPKKDTVCFVATELKFII